MELPGHVYNLDVQQSKILRKFWHKLIIELDTLDSPPPPSKSTKPTLTSQPKEPLQPSLPSFHALCQIFGYDHPDCLILRFIRARKWDFEKSMQMFLNSLKWRKEFGLLELIKTGEEILDQEELLLGKVYFSGVDLEGRPIAVIHVRLHDKNKVDQQKTQRLTALMLEDGRLIMKKPVETASLIFDLTGFGPANSDLNFTKFLVSTLEAHYPESLGAIMILNAPWLFQGFWSLVKPLLDPVVANKVHFVKDAELLNFISKDNIPPAFAFVLDPATAASTKKKEKDAAKDPPASGYKYIPPTHEPKDPEEYKVKLQKYEIAVENFKSRTKKWSEPEFWEEVVSLTAEEEEARKLRDVASCQEREKSMIDLVECYAELAPFVRSKTYNDRVGNIDYSNLPWTSYKPVKS
ncbi:hypothetical protein HK098_007106 [Nowakowskiella sp. JEL0407]|nr:hypothetical protein HK098_007106 [Nowakowskiella sp. JEL0407]